MAPNGSKRAPFIVIEGLDRSGKTTQTALLQSRLESELGASTKLMKFPDRTTTIGQMIDSYLKSDSELDDHVIHLLFSANRWELASTIERLLNEGTVVLCDRYAFSGIAFSASKVVPERSGSGESVPKLPFEWCRAPDIGLPAPDLVLFLDIAPEQAKQRGGYGEERYEKEEMQARVRQAFKRLGEETASGSDNRDNLSWRVIDAGRDVESVAADLWNAVRPLVSDGLTEPVGRLWADKI
ncbi:thymidylate kinase [Coprinopsis cinerea AmutBmut pab1-1]|nr:thymidylate kinase [Coprinopsis cinerea AmutBmut pab1-1]